MSSFITPTKHVSDVLAHVQRQFGDESGVQITNDDIIRWVNAGISDIFIKGEPLKATTYADTVAGQADYTLPADILRIQSILVNGIPVERRSTQEIEEFVLAEDVNGTEQGQPQLWSEWGGTITFYPRPDASVVNGITLKYIKGPTAVALPTDLLPVPDAYYNRLIEYVLQQAYELDENFSAADTKAAQFAQNLNATIGSDQTTYNTYPVVTVLEEDMY